MGRYAIISTIAAALLLTPVGGVQTCQTAYATTSTKRVPTSTVTRTATIKTTATVIETSTTTSTISTIFTVTIAPTTSTVPTGANFTPITSASSIKPSSRAHRQRRDGSGRGLRARHSPSPYPYKSQYPHSVRCTTTVTRTRTGTTTSTFLVGAYTGTTTTVTTHVPTATAYAACLLPGNIISSFHGHPLDDYAADHSLGICFSGNGNSGYQPCMSAESCCAAAQSSGYSGWQFTNFTGSANTCTILAGGVYGAGGFEFFSGPSNGHVFFGNGAGYGGVFGGADP